MEISIIDHLINLSKCDAQRYKRRYAADKSTRSVVLMPTRHRLRPKLTRLRGRGWGFSAQDSRDKPSTVSARLQRLYRVKVCPTPRASAPTTHRQLRSRIARPLDDLSDHITPYTILISSSRSISRSSLRPTESAPKEYTYSFSL